VGAGVLYNNKHYQMLRKTFAKLFSLSLLARNTAGTLTTGATATAISTYSDVNGVHSPDKLIDYLLGP